MAKDYLEQAKQSIRKLLELVPNWQPDPDQDPPPFTRLVEKVRREMEEAKKGTAPQTPVEQPLEKLEIEKPMEEPIAKPKPQKNGGGKKFLWVGLGVGAIGVGLGVLLFGTSQVVGAPPSGIEQLPDPPGGPGGN